MFPDWFPTLQAVGLDKSPRRGWWTGFRHIVVVLMLMQLQESKFWAALKAPTWYYFPLKSSEPPAKNWCFVGASTKPGGHREGNLRTCYGRRQWPSWVIICLLWHHKGLIARKHFLIRKPANNGKVVSFLESHLQAERQIIVLSSLNEVNCKDL